jgi:UDP-N-acetyl-D-glucosamine dehydrogenase
VVKKVADALNGEKKAVNGSRVLVLGVAYKKDIDDLRESPALEIIRQLQEKGAEVVYHDPFCPEIADDGHTPLCGLPMQSVELTDDEVRRSDAVVVVTDHSSVDYQRVADLAEVIVDTRGVMRGIDGNGRIESLSPLSRVRKVVRKVKKKVGV